MTILDFSFNQIGQAGIFSIIYLKTDNTLAEVLTPGYLNDFVNRQNIPLSELDVAWVVIKPTPTSIRVGSFNISKVGDNWSLILPPTEGGVILPTTPGHVATYVDTDGTLSQDPATAVIQHDLSVLGNITAPSGNIVATGNITSIGGNIQAGFSGTAGSLISYPIGLTNGFLALVAANNIGNTSVSISNSPMAGTRTFLIPDPLQSSANFLLDAGPSNLLSFRQTTPLINTIFSDPTNYVLTRNSGGNYSYSRTATGASIIAIDITPYIRTAANKGFSLQSFDVIEGIATLALNSHTAALYLITYADNSPVSVASVSLVSSGLPIGVRATNLFVTTISLSTPNFLNDPDSKYVIEISLNSPNGTVYNFYGITLNFQQTIA